MKTNESLLHKGMRTIIQSSLRMEASEPCNVYWTYSRIALKSLCRSRRIKSKTSMVFQARRIPEV